MPVWSNIPKAAHLHNLVNSNENKTKVKVNNRTRINIIAKGE